RGAGAAVLVQEADVRGERAGKREHDAEECGHKRAKPGTGAGRTVRCLTKCLGSGATQLESAASSTAQSRCWGGTPPVPCLTRSSASVSARYECGEAFLMKRPLLLIDVDGVISLFGFDPARRPEGRFEVVDGIAHFLSATAGDHLRRLCEVFEPAWCTGWEEKANEYLPGALGLSGPFPHLGFADATPTVAGHWKLAAIDAYAGPDRPVAWIDDAHDERCDAWA